MREKQRATKKVGHSSWVYANTASECVCTLYILCRHVEEGRKRGMKQLFTYPGFVDTVAKAERQAPGEVCCNLGMTLYFYLLGMKILTYLQSIAEGYKFPMHISPNSIEARK